MGEFLAFMVVVAFVVFLARKLRKGDKPNPMDDAKPSPKPPYRQPDEWEDRR